MKEEIENQSYKNKQVEKEIKRRNIPKKLNHYQNLFSSLIDSNSWENIILAYKQENKVTLYDDLEDDGEDDLILSSSKTSKMYNQLLFNNNNNNNNNTINLSNNNNNSNIGNNKDDFDDDSFFTELS